MDTDTKYLSTAELARVLRRCPDTLARWRRRHVGPPYLRLHGRVMYDEGKVRAWLAPRAVDESVPVCSRDSDATEAARL